MDLTSQIDAPHVHTFFIYARVEAKRVGFKFIDKENWAALKGEYPDFAARRDHGFGNVFYEHIFFRVPLPPAIRWRGKYDCVVTLAVRSTDEMTPAQIEKVKMKAAEFIAARQA